MEYRHLGKAGIKVSTLGFGAWVTFGQQYGEDRAYEIMKAAYEAGVNFFDNAEAYANGRAEEVMGAALKRAGWTRSDLVISTKIFYGGRGSNDRGLSYKHIIEGIDKSLKRLQLEYVDLIFCHSPDRHTPIEETVRAMNQVIHQGKAFYWGTSNWEAHEIMHAYAVARQEHLMPPSMEQPEYNMFDRRHVEVDFLHLYKEIGYGTTIYSPLASGLLTGKYNDGMPKDTRASLPGYEWLMKDFESEQTKGNIEKVKQLVPIAKDLGCTLAQLGLAWCAKNPNVSTVITGASRAEQVVENMKAIDVVAKLTPDVMERIEQVLQNRPELPD